MRSRRRSPIAGRRPIELRVEVDYERLRFAYRVGGSAWQWLPQQFDASILSDEATAPGLPNFTGAFVGMACQDLAGHGACRRTSIGSNTGSGTTWRTSPRKEALRQRPRKCDDLFALDHWLRRGRCSVSADLCPVARRAGIAS